MKYNAALSTALIILLACFSTAGEVEWTAYNDCIGSSAHYNVNTTDYSAYLDFSGQSSGPLVNDTTGSTDSMPTVTFTIPSDPAIQPKTVLNYGVNPDTGTDACDIFCGKVDFSGTIIQHCSSCSEDCWFVAITFTGLNPARLYTFTGAAFRNSEYPDRESVCTILGADSYSNTSSDGVVFKDGDTTIFRAADNSNEGFVVRWDEIVAGEDGSFTIYTISGDSDGRQGYPLHGFMLSQINNSSNEAPYVDAGAGGYLILPRIYLTLDGVVTDDGNGLPDGFLSAKWSQLSGPAEAQFSDDTNPQATVRFPVAGTYILQLKATDGELTSLDTVTVTVSEPLCPEGDVNGDCITNLQDMALIGIDWLDESSAALADLDGDSLVSISELTLLAMSWLENWTGSLRVELSPAEAIEAGAMWRVDGGSWQNSSDTVFSLPAGEHTLEFALAQGWTKPGEQTVNITRSSLNVHKVEYVMQRGDILINEFMAINSYIPFINPLNIYARYPWNSSSSGNVYLDWIELRNNSQQAVNLAGWYLTDDPADLTKWQFPADSSLSPDIQPGDYLVLFASGKDAGTFPDNYPFADYYGNLHTNFKLSSTGGHLAIVSPDGQTVSDICDYPQQIPYKSYGIAADNSVGYLSEPSAGYFISGHWTGWPNSDTSIPAMVEDTKFSVDRGFYDAPFDVLITCDTPEAEIHYTIDGSEPAESVGGSTLLYSGPVQISGTTCLRAKAFKSGLIASNTDTQTYIMTSDVVLQQRPNDSRYSTSWTICTADYAMEDDSSDIKLVAGSSSYSEDEAKAVIEDALKSLPVLSIASSPENLFGSTIGIYTHPANSGDAWERPISVEYFNAPDGTEFQVNCGIQITGFASRDNDPKHSFSLRFRGGYGDADLKEKLFSQTDVETFDTLQLRATYNNSWTHWDANQRPRGTLLRDQLNRDAIIAMGQQGGGSGRFVHLYLDGLYWGVYDLHERPEASHYASYEGGDSEYYDALNGGEVSDGDSTAWNEMQQTVSSGLRTTQAGWEAIKKVLDVDNYIDWTIVQHYALNQDLKTDGNWRVAGGGVFRAPWNFYLWDTERTSENGNSGNTSPVSDFNSPFLLGYLDDIPEFRQRFADRLYKHFHSDGALTYEAASARLAARAAEIERAVIAESARWGDCRRDVFPSGTSYLYTKKDFWEPQIALLDSYFALKPANTISHFRQLPLPLYPNIEPPAFKIGTAPTTGGYIGCPVSLGMSTSDVGLMYYTLDGSDPREYWTGAISGTAKRYLSSTIDMSSSTRVKARLNGGGQWSALADAVFADSRLNEAIRITEVMYHPRVSGTEYIELHNISSSDLNVKLMSFSSGIDHSFDYTYIPAGGYALLVKDIDAFTAFYSDIPAIVSVRQWVSGSLDNDSEKITLKDPLGENVLSFKYKDSWYVLTDGEGFSLTISDPTQPVELWDDSAGWRASVQAGGTPGRAALGALAPDSIVINELLAHSHAEAPDWIELYNKTAYDIDLGGWFLSDSTGNEPDIMKYRIPAGTTIPSQGYIVFYENETFGNIAADGCFVPFGLSEGGESLYLFSGAGTAVTGLYSTAENFDASPTGRSFGRYEKTELSGGYDFAPMTEPTPGSINTLPYVPPVVITEIYYHPSEDSDYEFVELCNRSASAVALETDVSTETSQGVFITQRLPWRIDGIGFDFPAGITLAPGEVVVVAKNPALACYAGLGKVFGPYSGALNNNGEQIELQIQGDLEYGSERYMIPLEIIDYSDSAPWPISADGSGYSLNRIYLDEYARDYTNWRALAPSHGEL
jgi:hypothetical protein